jgi:hypothetical protein
MTLFFNFYLNLSFPEAPVRSANNKNSLARISVMPHTTLNYYYNLFNNLTLFFFPHANKFLFSYNAQSLGHDIDLTTGYIASTIEKKPFNLARTISSLTAYHEIIVDLQIT